MLHRSFAAVLVTVTLAAGAADAGTWFARAGATGNGSSVDHPLGSSAEIESSTKAGDTIILLAGEQPLDDGVRLKTGQTLMGLVEGNRKPTITNTTVGQNGGNGVVLADGARVLNVSVERTQASGVIGNDVRDCWLQGVDVRDANQSAGVNNTEAKVLGPIAHGGILFVASRAGSAFENHVLECTVSNTAGLGIGTFALGGSRSRLTIRHTRAAGGTLVPPMWDGGVIALADGQNSESHLEMADVTVSGRLGQQGRNVIVFASAGATAAARIERSTLGETGQDGIVAVAALVPATAEVEVRDSTIEKAGQTNIEGSILNLPPSDSERAGEGFISIDVEDCVIREAGAVDGFRSEAQNFWLGPTVFGSGPFAGGRYQLAVRNSIVEKAFKTGIALGNSGSEFKIAPDEGEYRVLLRNNTIRDNGQSEITITATKARIDAKRNYWGTPAGVAGDRIVLLDGASRSQLDDTQPLPRPEKQQKWEKHQKWDEWESPSLPAADPIPQAPNDPLLRPSNEEAGGGIRLVGALLIGTIIGVVLRHLATRRFPPAR